MLMSESCAVWSHPPARYHGRDGLIDMTAGELTLPLASCITQERKFCTLHFVEIVGKPAPRIETWENWPYYWLPLHG